jgi:hypothetical protein
MLFSYDCVFVFIQHFKQYDNYDDDDDDDSNKHYLCCFVGNLFDALPHWNEAKDLFLHLFSDGILIPLLRRASLPFLREVYELLNKLIRFMIMCEKTIMNLNLALLDIQALLSYEIENVSMRRRIDVKMSQKKLLDLIEKNCDGEDLLIAAAVSGKMTTSKQQQMKLMEIEMGQQNPIHDNIEFDDYDDHDRANAMMIKNDFDNNNIFNSVKILLNKLSLHGFESERVFYNLFNAEIVLDKTHDYGWSRHVDYEQMLNFKALNDNNNNKNNDNKNNNNTATADEMKLMMMNETCYETSLRINNMIKLNYHLKNHKIPSSLLPYILKQDDIFKRSNNSRISKNKDVKSKHHHSRHRSHRHSHHHHHHHRLSIQKLKKMQETPLDPFTDFYFMNENYTDYRVLHNIATKSSPQLSSSPHSLSSLSSTIHETPLYTSMFLSELNENYEKDMTASTAFSKKSPLYYLNNNYFKEIDHRCEIILIQRIWNCFVRIKKYKNDYYSHQFNSNQLRHTVRNNLVTLSLFMTRLRAFSRQLQPSLLDIFNTTATTAGTTATTEGTTDTSTSAVNEIVGNSQSKNVVTGKPFNYHSNSCNNGTTTTTETHPLANHNRLSSFVYAIHVRLN